MDKSLFNELKKWYEKMALAEAEGEKITAREYRKMIEIKPIIEDVKTFGETALENW